MFGVYCPTQKRLATELKQSPTVGERIHIRRQSSIHAAKSSFTATEDTSHMSHRRAMGELEQGSWVITVAHTDNLRTRRAFQVQLTACRLTLQLHEGFTSATQLLQAWMGAFTGGSRSLLATLVLMVKVLHVSSNVGEMDRALVVERLILDPMRHLFIKSLLQE